GDRQAFALDSQNTLWRIKDGVYTSAGFGGVEIAVSNVGDDNPSNDVVFLRDSSSKLWFWNQTYWTDTGGYLPTLRAGDNQLFSVGFDGQVWRYRVAGTGAGSWTASGGWGVQIVVASAGDTDPTNDLVFLRGSDNSTWLWTQTSWRNLNRSLTTLAAGD